MCLFPERGPPDEQPVIFSGLESWNKKYQHLLFFLVIFILILTMWMPEFEEPQGLFLPYSLDSSECSYCSLSGH